MIDKWFIILALIVIVIIVLGIWYFSSRKNINSSKTDESNINRSSRHNSRNKNVDSKSASKDKKDLKSINIDVDNNLPEDDYKTSSPIVSSSRASPFGTPRIQHPNNDKSRTVIIKTEDNRDLVIPIGSPGRKSPRPINLPCVSRISNPSQSETSHDIDLKNSHGIIDITPKPLPNIPHEPYIPDTQRSSKGEKACRDALWEIFHKHFPRVRPDFLKNPKTGRNMELDCYNDELKIAVEYNGRQHYVWPSFPGFTKEKFVEQIRRDQLKLDICDQLGIYLITVPYSVPLKKIKAYIITMLQPIALN